MKRAGLAWFKGVYNCEHTMLENTFEIHTKINTQKTFMNLVPFQQSFGVYNCQTYETSNCFSTTYFDTLYIATKTLAFLKFTVSHKICYLACRLSF